MHGPSILERCPGRAMNLGGDRGPDHSGLIKFVIVGVSRSGSGTPAALPASMHLMSQAMLRARVRIVCRPYRSWRTSSGVFPWTWFQYWEDTIGMLVMLKYFRRRS